MKGFNTEATKDAKESRQTCPDSFDTKPSELGDDTLKIFHLIRVVMPRRNICVLLAVVLLLTLMNLNTIATMSSDLPSIELPTYFDITIIASANHPTHCYTAQIASQELWKIGIKSEIVFVGYDNLLRMFQNSRYETYAMGGFDIGFISWTASVLDTAKLRYLFHSSNIDKSIGASNYYPIDNSTLDDLLDRIEAEPDIPTCKDLVQQALDIIIWEEHPSTGVCQYTNPYALDADVRDFDATRWSIGEPNLQEMYYNSSGQNQFRFASTSRFRDLNPALSDFYKAYDSLFHSPVYSSLFEHDENLEYQPVLASGQPIAIGSNDVISDVIDPASIDPASSYYGETTWGDSPNIDNTQYSANVTASDKSMFLVNLREGIPWQPGYGYQLGDFDITADDLIWSLSYILNDEIPQPHLAVFQNIWGVDYTKAIEKINDTLVKINLRGPLGNGRLADYYRGLAITPHPRHILDPTFDAGPYNGSMGVTPDGTTIANYTDHRNYAFNTGDKPTIQAGPYYMENWTESTQTAFLKKFDSWGGEGANSLWNEAPYNNTNRIETYEVIVIDQKSTAELALENEEIDGIDYNFHIGMDIPSLENKSNIQISTFVDASVHSMGYNTRHPRLSNRFVRLAISHILSRQQVVDHLPSGLGIVNEVDGLSVDNPYYPDEEAWQTIGLPESFNKDGLEFQGHISYDLEKAWALMEYAGYNMDLLRASIKPEWGLQPGDKVSWKFVKMKCPADAELSSNFLEWKLIQSENGQDYVLVPAYEGSVISIEVIDTNELLWVRRELDGVQGLTQAENSFFVLPMTTNWTSCWSGGKIERNDDKSLALLFELNHEESGTNATYRIEYDKNDGTLRRLELEGITYNQSIDVLIVRMDLLDKEDNENKYNFLLDLSPLVIAITAALGAFLGGIVLAQMLKKRRKSSQ